MIRGLPIQGAMPSFLVVPFVIAIQDHLRVVDRIELITIDWLREMCGLPPTAGGLFVSGGSMANLTAGKGDSLTSFDLTAAVLAAGIGHIVQAGATAKPGVQLLPREVWSSCLA